MNYNQKEYVWYRDKSWYPIKVSEIVKTIDFKDFNTIIPILQKLNYPALQDEWRRTVEHCINQGQGIEIMFKKYISKMWLQAYKPLTFMDTTQIEKIRQEKYKQALENLSNQP